MLTRGNQTLPWTVDNRVASVSISGGGTTSMEYDYSGMRVKKSAPAITLYPVAGYEIDPNGVITKFIRVGGESIAPKKGTAKYFYHNDHLGGVNVVTDATGVRVQLNEYDSWGSVSRASGSVDPDTGFTRQKLDPECRLYYSGGRYYDAEIGRFVSAGPFVQTPYDPQNLNRYSYVVNSPPNYVDPDGYFHRQNKKSSFWSKFFFWHHRIFMANTLLVLDPPMLAVRELSSGVAKEIYQHVEKATICNRVFQQNHISFLSAL
jgi:RHS repeat-associated protein